MRSRKQVLLVTALALALGAGMTAPSQTALAAGGSEPTARTEDGIRKFAGAWVGKTTDDTAVERKATLTIDPGENGGFSITWTSFEAPTKSDSGIIRRERTLDFEATGTPGLFRAKGPNDPVNDLAAWAHIDGDVLSVSTIAVRADGQLERQIYDRTVSKDGLFLSYRRYLDADMVRMIEAEFVHL